MASQIIINGREVTNPVAKFFVFMIGFSFALAAAALLIFIVLPLIGLTITFSFGIIVVFFLAMLIFLPLLAALLVWLGLLSIPYHLFKGTNRDKSP